MSQVLTKSEILGKLFKEYGLYFDPKDPNSKDNDVFTHAHYKIITRSGIEKIQKAAGITITYLPIFVSETACYIKATGTKGTDTIETFASASASTSKNAYYPEMCEKRAASRIVLKLAGLYEYGVFGADETDEWSDKAQERGRAQYKGEK